MPGFELPPVRQQITGDASGYTSAMEAAAAATGTLGSSAAATAGLLAGGAGLAVAAADATQEAMELEEQTADLRKLLDESATIQLREDLLDLSDTMPIARSELFETGEAAARLGIRGTDNLRTFTRVMGEVGVATDESAGQAATSLARLANITDTPISKIRNLAAATNRLSNTMATSFSEIDDSAKRAAAGLAPLGLRADEIVALDAALVEVSASARRAGTRLRSFGLSLDDPDREPAFAEALGVTTERFRELRAEDPAGVILQLAEVMQQGGERARALSGEMTRIGRTVLNQLAANLDGAREALEEANSEFENATSLQREYSKRVDTAAARQQVVNNRIKNLRAEIGQNFLPLWKEVLEVTAGVVGAFQDLATTELEQILPEQEAEALKRELEQLEARASGDPFIGFKQDLGFVKTESEETTKQIIAMARALDTEMAPAFTANAQAMARNAEDSDQLRAALVRLFRQFQRGSEETGTLDSALKTFRERANTSEAEANELAQTVDRLGAMVPSGEFATFEQKAATAISGADGMSQSLRNTLRQLAIDLGAELPEAAEEAGDAMEQAFLGPIDVATRLDETLSQLVTTMREMPTPVQVGRQVRARRRQGVTAAQAASAAIVGPDVPARLRSGRQAGERLPAGQRVNVTTGLIRRGITPGSVMGKINEAMQRGNEEGQEFSSVLEEAAGVLASELNPALRELREEAPAVVAGLRAFINVLEEQFTQGDAGGGIVGGILNLGRAAVKGLQHGGRLERGEPAVVGEGGEPELFVPDRAGTVIPESKIGGDTVQLNANFDIRAVDAEGVEQVVRTKAAPAILDVVMRGAEDHSGVRRTLQSGRR